ncbi:MAG: UDP-N-acetylmuramate dehydrogenase [Acidimicrobiales bacterium]
MRDRDVAGVIERAAGILGPLAQRGVPLGPMTTYRVGGPAALFVRAEEDEHLRLVARAVRETGVEVLIVGNGSNLLVADAGFAGLAVALGETYATIEVVGTLVRAGAAALLPVVARRTAAAGLTGFEWAVGVPGSIGGAVRMNAGGHGSDMAAVLSRVRLLDLCSGEDEIVPVDRLGLAFRHSDVQAHQVVLWAELQLARGEPAASEQLIAEVVRWRREHQPGGANAGSVFVNPAGDSAGRLIDAAGCRGLRLGSARVSEKHANFIQADEGGSADDIERLMREVWARVVAHSGVRLRPETRLVGFGPAPWDGSP